MEKTHPQVTTLAAGLLSLLFALNPGAYAAQSNEKPVAGGILNVGLGSDTPIIDPHITAYGVTALIARNVVDSLVGQAEDN
ncbi:ABC transporter substrate-binding protein, partial [Pectobacterium aroidearum]